MSGAQELPVTGVKARLTQATPPIVYEVNRVSVGFGVGALGRQAVGSPSGVELVRFSGRTADIPLLSRGAVVHDDTPSLSLAHEGEFVHLSVVALLVKVGR